MPRDDEDGMADQEERMINEEYKIWKKNTPFLYGAHPSGRSTPHTVRARRSR